MSRNVNCRPKSISHLISNYDNNNNVNNEPKTIKESSDNRFRTYNVKDLKTTQTYLPQEVLRDYKKGFEASTKSPSTPKSRNFVRKLVANLEGKKYQGSGHCTADDEFVSKCYSRPAPKNHITCRNPENKKNCLGNKNFTYVKNFKKSHGSHKRKDFKISVHQALENLSIDDYVKLNSAKNAPVTKKDSIFDNKLKFWSTKNVKEEKCADDLEQVTLRHSFPFSKTESDSQSSSKKENSSKNKKCVFKCSGHIEERKSFKEVLGSLIGFKSRNPSLPKGNRGIFSPKDSLGEEMRIFRRDTMPVLLKSSKPKIDFEDIPRGYIFSSSGFAASKSPSDNRSASIHPHYGGKKGAPLFLKTLQEENFQIYANLKNNEFPESSSQSQENDFESVAQSSKNVPLYQKPPEIIYDVPKSRKVLNYFPSEPKRDENCNIYQNIDVFDERNWHKIAQSIPRKNIVCGKRALFIRKHKKDNKC